MDKLHLEAVNDKNKEDMEIDKSMIFFTEDVKMKLEK